MEDPLSAVHDRPHRYLLESDSSDEEGQGLYSTTESGPSKSKSPSTTLTASDVQITGSWDAYEEIVLGVGQAGRYLTKSLGLGNKGDIEVKAGGTILGSGWTVGKRLLLSVDEGGLETGLHGIAQVFIDKAGQKSWLVVSTYLPSLYIPDRAFTLPTAPVRYLSINAGRFDTRDIKNAEPITSPNYVTGLAAAILSKLTTTSAESKITASLVLLPLPLSFVPLSDLTQTLTQLSPVSDPLPISRTGSRWSEHDDEPFAQAGMGMGKNRDRPALDAKREVDGMYM